MNTKFKSTLLFAALVAATLGTAQAEGAGIFSPAESGTPPVTAVSFGGATLQCTPHKGLLGGADGQDCRLTGKPGAVGATTIHATDLDLWCNGSTMADISACKGTGQAELQSRLAQGFPGGLHLRLALDCVSPPAAGGPMLCKDAVEVGKAK
jgi:hypothetical protein